MSKAVTTFINSDEGAQLAIINAARNGSFYVPKLDDERLGVETYWRTIAGQHGDGALFTKRIELPYRDGVAFAIHPDAVAYARLLFVGQEDLASVKEGDYAAHGSQELRDVLTEATNTDANSFGVAGALKWEALGMSLHDQSLVPVGEVTLDPEQPQMFRIAASTVEPKAA